MKLLLTFFVFFATTQALALDPKKCFKTTHGSGLIKYEFPGYSSAEYLTKKYGTTGGTSEYSLQNMTASADPSVTSGRITSSSEYSTSTGDCSYYSLNKELRIEYIARNTDSILQEVAMGRGQHLQALYFYNGCAQGGMAEFQEELQGNFGRIRLTKDQESFSDEIEDLIHNNQKLSQLCEVS